jgi:hypothetical protein
LVLRVREATEHFAERLASDLAKDGTPAIKEVEGPYETATRDDVAALAIAVLHHVQGMQFDRENTRRAYLVAYVLSGFEDKQTLGNLADAIRDVAVQSLYEYLDEQIDGRNAVLGLLVKYKSRSELYRRHRLREAAVNGLEGRTGERALAFDLYEYLHDQGVDFSIESVSASGEPDLVASESSGRQLVADAKYVNDSSDPRKVIAQGFRQVLDYCRDHNEPVGYLVVFVNRDLVLDLKGDRDDGFPCFRTGGYTVYYVIIDIHEHASTASKRPKPRVLEISTEEVILDVKASGEATTDPVPVVEGPSDLAGGS